MMVVTARHHDQARHISAIAVMMVVVMMVMVLRKLDIFAR